MMRGTSPDLYIRVPSSSAFMAAITLGPSRNAQSYAATWAWPRTSSESASAPVAPGCRMDTTVSRLMMPMTITAASNIRLVTKPSASVSFCRLTTGNSATALPMQASALTRSRTLPHTTWVSAPELRM